ncbi:AsmA-like C-terminal region-containing protein [Flavobacterium sp.]|uniref:AsmA family protein n=1 Tax=Flavobacterium sp. TaxID=239 RepID=UPI003B9C611E
MLKKILKITGITLLILIILLFSAPILFKDQIIEKVKKSINESVAADVNFSDVDLSLLRNFPNASVRLTDFKIINKAPFQGDTLVSIGEISLKMSISELFKSENEPIVIQSFATENGVVNIRYNKDGISNFDIALKDESEKDDKESKPLNLSIDNYEIKNYKITYTDERSGVFAKIDSLNHSGIGDFASEKLDLETKTSAKITAGMNKDTYLNNVAFGLDAVLGLDLKNSLYQFKENKAKINQLELNFDGSLAMKENQQIYDLTFSTLTSDFVNFLALIPEKYSGNLKDVSTTGKLVLKGFAKGVLSETEIPKFAVEMKTDGASFKYASMPKSVQNISIDAKIQNDSGNTADTYLAINQFNFQIDQDVFSAKATVKNLTGNQLVDAAVKGKINLSNFAKAYPVKLDTPLSGILTADLQAAFDVASVQNAQYEKVKSSGTASLSGFTYTTEDKKKYYIKNSSLAFNPSQIKLENLELTTGKTDLRASGVIQDFYGYAFANKNLKGNFTLFSNSLSTSDFMSATPATTTASAPKSELKIPAFLDCSIAAKINTLYYDNLTLRNNSATAIIKDEKIQIKDFKTNVFGGSIGANGSVSTKTKQPVFDMALKMNQVDINQTFTQLEMMKNLAPIAGAVNGKINTTIDLKGALDAQEMTPVLSTITGDLFGQFLSTTINEKNAGFLNSLSSSLKFIDVSKINLNDVKANLSFANGKVNIKPFNLKYQDISAVIGGSHGFDQVMNYDLKLNVPAKYFGSELNKLAAKITPADMAKLDNVPINAVLTGSFSKPKVSTDMKAAVTNLTNQLVKKQKDKLIDKGTTALDNLISGSKKDTTKTNSTKTKAKNLLNGLLNKKKKE